MTEPMNTETKIAAARDAVEKAAALLLDHAEGIALLAMLALRAEPPGIAGAETISMRDAGRPMSIRNWPAEQAFWASTVAAATFAGRFEAFRQARDGMWPNMREAALHQAVEELVGPDGGSPPPLSTIEERLRRPTMGLTPKRVHAQAWRSHLAANASRLTMVKSTARTSR